MEPTGQLPDGREFQDIAELQRLLTADPRPLLTNLAKQLAVYSTGREILFSDRDRIAAIVAATEKHGGGLRTLIHQLVQSELFQMR